MSDYFSLKVKDIVKETPDAVTIQFKQPLFRKVKYEPGQFLTLIFNIGGKQVRRAYSMSSAPHLDNYVEVTVKRVPDGLVSNYINDKLQKGDTVEVMKPMGKFTVETSKDNARHLVLFAGGSGITPLMSIMKSVLYLEPKSTISLVYSNSHEDCIIFKGKIQELQQKFGERLQVVHVLSKPKQAHGGYTGRLDAAKVVNIVNLLPKAEHAVYYVCGPEGMMEAVKDGLKLAKVPNGKIHTESFFAAASEDLSKLGPLDSKQVTINISGDSHKVWVPANKNILEAALDAGINMPFSCQSGVCTACMGKCVSGDVKMSATDGLSEAEMGQGYRLLCVGHPTTDDVVIDMD